MSDEQKILDFLADSNATSEESAIPTIEIARHIHGKGASRKMVNPTLYKMKGIEKVCEDKGVNPRWYLK